MARASLAGEGGVGGPRTDKPDGGLLAGTRRELAAEVGSGRFREEHHSRLGGVGGGVPPLRERREDIPLLEESFLREQNRRHGRRVTRITRGALDRLAAHVWPGNVRELENVVEGMVILARGRRALDLSDLP